MCWECLKRTCYNIVNLQPDELEKVRNMNQITQKFLVKRKSIIGCLKIIIAINIVINTLLVTMGIIGLIWAFTSSDNGLELAIAGGLSLLMIVVSGIILLILPVLYYHVKSWYDSWYNYKESIRYSRYIAIMMFIIYPIVNSLLYINVINDNVKLLENIINTCIPFISAIHIILLKSNNLSRDVRNSYEYEIITTSLRFIYIPIIVLVPIISIIMISEILVFVIAILYVIMIIISCINNCPCGERIENAITTAIVIILMNISVKYDIAIISRIPMLYLVHTINSIVVIDLINDWIMRKRQNIRDVEGNIGIIARDTGYDNSELVQLRSGYENVPQLERNPMQEP